MSSPLAWIVLACRIRSSAHLIVVFRPELHGDNWNSIRCLDKDDRRAPSIVLRIAGTCNRTAQYIPSRACFGGRDCRGLRQLVERSQPRDLRPDENHSPDNQERPDATGHDRCDGPEDLRP